MLKTPILLIVFNRPDITRQVFDAIRDIRPTRLYVAADGPREGVDTDLAACAETRAVATDVDWECDVHALFRDENLGCGRAVSSAVTWFLGNVDAGIILEDDCRPDPSFFHFCEELLERYRDTPRVMMISGDNFLQGRRRGTASYYFSRYPHIWGWATWHRAWQDFNYQAIAMEWDSQWRLTLERNNGFAVAPNVNLVTNIGCGRVDATHTTEKGDRYANLPAQPMAFPLIHPRRIRKMDRYIDYSLYFPKEMTYWGLPRVFALRAYYYLGHRARSLVKRALLPTPLYDPLRGWVTERRQTAELAAWETEGKPIPPPHCVKQRVLREYARRYDIRVLVETGTYSGDMVEAMRRSFDVIYSIELSKTLHEEAVTRFKGVDNVELIYGDSGIELEHIMDRISQNALFWLDGHYSAGVTAKGDKDTPILEELRHILNASDREHVIIVDDARCFGTNPAYPSVEELSEVVRSMRPNVNIAVQDDSIRITPRR